MIDAKELRIGNYYICADDNEVVSVGDAYSLSLIEEYNNAKPIPLTEEILLDCGWGKGDYDFEFIDNVSLDDEVLSYDVKVKVLIIQCNRDTIYLYHIKHLHQLQNLYFALTNKELEYKPK